MEEENPLRSQVNSVFASLSFYKCWCTKDGRRAPVRRGAYLLSVPKIIYPATISFRKIRKFWHDLDELDSRCIFIGVGLYRGLSDSPTFGRVSRTTCAHARREKGVPSSEKKLESIQKIEKRPISRNATKNLITPLFLPFFAGPPRVFCWKSGKHTAVVSPHHSHFPLLHSLHLRKNQTPRLDTTSPALFLFLFFALQSTPWLLLSHLSQHRNTKDKQG